MFDIVAMCTVQQTITPVTRKHANAFWHHRLFDAWSMPMTELLFLRCIATSIVFAELIAQIMYKSFWFWSIEFITDIPIAIALKSFNWEIYTRTKSTWFEINVRFWINYIFVFLHESTLTFSFVSFPFSSLFSLQKPFFYFKFFFGNKNRPIITIS